ncbi:hypothetical protein EDD11_002826 [Mortierella claussenii]|nr:hypothetical protein EDD11_002826 [Mortierella claussenii]
MHDFVVGSSQPPAGAVSESSFEPAPISTPDDTIANEITSSKPIAVVPDPAEGAAPITLNPPTLIVHASMPSGSGPVSSIVGKDQESINTDRDTGSSSNHTRTIVDPHQHHPPHFEHLQPSERLSRLLNPTPSTASLPSITRTISHPVLATTSPKLLSHGDDSGEHLDSAAKSSNDLSLRHGASQHHQQQRHLISPVSEMMSKFLSPYKQTRSQSQTNLAAGGASQRPHKRTGSDVSATSAVRAEQQQRHHPQQQQQRFQYKRQPPQRANNASTGGRLVSMMSPPRSSGGEAAAYLISRFLPTSPTQQFSQYGSPMPKNGSMFTSSVGTSIVPSAGPEVTSTSGSGAGSGVGTGLGSASASRRRLPASLRMTSAASSTPMNDSSSQLEPTTPSSINSSFSDMPSPSHDDGSNAVFSDSINSDQNNSSGSAWNHVEAMSRTQQKLLLQRASSQVDLDEDEMARRGKMMKDMERLQREYRCVRLFADPVIESLVRSQILKRHVEPGQGERRFVGQTAGEDEREMQRSYSSLSIKSM